jgi:hypothetical protein
LHEHSTQSIFSKGTRSPIQRDPSEIQGTSILLSPKVDLNVKERPRLRWSIGNWKSDGLEEPGRGLRSCSYFPKRRTIQLGAVCGDEVLSCAFHYWRYI